MNARRNISIDALRGIAALFVVIIHLTGYIKDNPIDVQWMAANVYNSMARWTVPVFVMISGAFLLKKEEESLQSLWSKRIKRILILLVFWNLVYGIDTILPDFDFSKMPLGAWLMAKYHLWYLYMLIGLYLLLPLLRLLVKHNYEMYILGLWFVFEILANSVYLVDIFSGYMFLNGFGYIGYFVLGYYLLHKCQWIHTPKIYRLVYLVGFLMVGISMLIRYYVKSQTGELDDFVSNNLSVYVLFPSIAVFVFFMRIKISENSRWVPVIKLLADCSLGVYLIHPLMLRYGFPFISSGIASIYTYLLAWVIASGLSIAATYILLKIPFINKVVK